MRRNSHKTPLILFAGGGTLGPVTPLLAVAEAWKKADPIARFVWVGTPYGPERELIEKARIPFHALPVARFPRYPSREWLLFPWRAIRALFEAHRILKKMRPSLIASAGGYTAVPLVILGRLFGIPSWIHQSDVQPILSNRLMAPFASLVTVTWKQTNAFFPKHKTAVVGNPARASLQGKARTEALAHFGLDASRPTLLVLGGGGGSAWLNGVVAELSAWLASRVNLIHITGKGKLEPNMSARPQAFVAELLTDDLADAWAAADIVLCRAGMGTITELAAFGKPAIIVPLPKNAQVANARALQNLDAAIVLSQDQSSCDSVRDAIKSLLTNSARRNELEKNIQTIFPTAIATDLVERLQNLIKK